MTVISRVNESNLQFNFQILPHFIFPPPTAKKVSHFQKNEWLQMAMNNSIHYCLFL